MRLIITAYEVLSDPEKRKQYDLINARQLHSYRFNYHDFLKSRSDDESLSKLIFFDLLHHREEEAIEIFDKYRKIPLEVYLDREDFMDCAFLLAEEYELRGNFIKAYELLITTVQYEIEKPYFRHFFREVVDRLRILTCFKMPGIIPNNRLVQYLHTLVKFDFSPKDSAFFLKKIAEIYAEENAMKQAAHYLDEGLKRHSKLPGIKKLREKLACAAS